MFDAWRNNIILDFDSGGQSFFQRDSSSPPPLRLSPESVLNKENPTRLTGGGTIKKQDFYFEPDFRPETAPFFEPAFSFNAYPDGRWTG